MCDLSAKHLLFVILTLFCLAAGPVQSDDTDGFRSVSGPCRFDFPADHGAHPGFRTEWWYYTGNLTASGGEPFGFQLTFFRRQLRASESKRAWPVPASVWRANQVFLAHAALTDLSGGRHVMAEKVSRQGPGLAGALTDATGTRIFLHDWEALIKTGGHRLRMAAPEFALTLNLTPTKGPVAHGEQGYSRKGSLPDQASCYYSFPRLAASGQVRNGENTYAVTGLGWMDHEYSTAPLAEEIIGWDWFSIQLDNEQELMLFLLRMREGGIHPASSGTLIGPQGRPTHLAQKNFRARATRSWTSPETKAVYPLGWEIHFPEHAMRLHLTAALDDQEMITSDSTGVTYWEGSIAVKGQAGGKPLAGRGYMELTGYADPNAPPL